MSKFKNADEVLDFAIRNEEEAAAFYLEMVDRTRDPSMQEAFKTYASEEEGHKTKLEKVKNSTKHFKGDFRKVEDLKIVDYLVDIKPHPNMSYQEILTIAMKQEKAAYKLYTDLADSTTEPTLKSLFIGLAQEEAKHKLRFEIEYEREFMREN